MKPRVCIVADVKTWAWARKAAQLELHLGDEFDMVTVFPYEKQPDAVPGTGFDLIAANGGTFCAFRQSDRHVAISTNGTSWTEYATGVATPFNSLTSGGGVFLASGLDNAFWTSVDGITWTERALSPTKPWQGACYDGSGFSIVDSSTGSCCYIRANVLAITNPTLSSIVSEECIRSGLLSAGDIDVASLTSTVRGYLVASTGTIRSALEPLQAAWPFDVVQRGYKIKFLPRGGSSVVTIDADDLDARSASGKPGVQITTSREMDSQLPRVLTIKHVDYDREYGAGEQYVERLNTDAINDVKMELPIVLTAGEAVGKAETLLYLRWLERFDVSFSIPGTYNQLEPGDVVTLETPEGNISLRLVAINYTSDGRLECRAKYNNADLPVLFFQGFSGDLRPRSASTMRSKYTGLRRLAQPVGCQAFTASDYASWTRSLAQAASSALLSEPSPIKGEGCRVIRHEMPRTSFVNGSDNDAPVSFAALDLGSNVAVVGVSAEAVVAYLRKTGHI